MIVNDAYSMPQT